MLNNSSIACENQISILNQIYIMFMKEAIKMEGRLAETLGKATKYWHSLNKDKQIEQLKPVVVDFENIFLSWQYGPTKFD